MAQGSAARWARKLKRLGSHARAWINRTHDALRWIRSRLAAVDDDDVSAVAHPSTGVAEPSGRPMFDAIPAEQSRGMFFYGGLHGCFRNGDWVRAGRCRRRGLHGVSRHLHELLGPLVLTVLLAHLGFEAERATRFGSEAAADLGSKRATDEATKGAAGDGQQLLCRALQPPANRLADGRTDNRADRLSGLADQVTEKPIELCLIGDFEQFAGEFHRFSFAENLAAPLGFAGPFVFAGLVGFHLWVVFKGIGHGFNLPSERTFPLRTGPVPVHGDDFKTRAKR